ncbi:hypothetical protein P280DRAFT_49747 [Massarina eburnea CBS 473.64]|uniref:Uncharacterized protein n=1 Tax=Massarina eburnea CBS 473.64 TaxID=1395130 RepID=A0A6A6S029_9PLEO|nr:hypothetical protein P280DRAFT_49747 [Massarina eburnea CBS 473.64]
MNQRLTIRRINVINRRLIDLGKEIDGAQKERDLIKKAQKILERQKIQKEELEPLLADPLFTLEKDLAGFDKIFDTAILAYARSSSHSFAAAMHKSLPRELRDEVYEYLLDDVTVNVIGRQVRWQVDHAHCNRGVCFEAIPIPQFLEPEFAPVDLRKEILQISAMKYRWACTDIFTPPNFEACSSSRALPVKEVAWSSS